MTDTQNRAQRFTWEDGDIVVLTEKHLGGEHNQDTHGNRGGLETVNHDNQQALDRLRQEAESFPAGPRRNEAQEALKPSKWDRVLVKRDSEGKLQGVASVWREPDKPGKYDEVPDGRYIRIRNMATAGRGQGRGLFSDVVEQAVSQRAGVYLSSLEGSRSFYESLGLQRGIGATYYLTFEQAQQWAGASKRVM